MLSIKIFLSSPGDVAEERALALQTIERLSYDPVLRGRVELQAIAWDKPGATTPMLATKTPQEAVNSGLSRPSDCDVVIVLFWSRMGTPLPATYTKPDGSRYQSGTEWEYLDALSAAQTVGRPDILVYRRTQDISLSPSDPEFLTKYEQWQQVNNFFESFKDTDGSLKQGYNSYQTPDMFRKNLEHHLMTLLKKRLAAMGDPQPSFSITRKLWTRSPFPGLVSFTERDAPIFFGRGREIDELVDQVRESRFVAVVGASGSGKSSLVAAGLIPRLRENAIEGSATWKIIRFTPSSDPFAALQAAAADIDADFMAQWHNLPNYLLPTNGPESAEVVLYIDQFEELFTLTDDDMRGHFVTALGNLPDRVRVVLTVRADFYEQCVAYPTLAELLRHGSYPLAAPGIAALYEMISRPAALAGLEMSESLVQQILDDMGSDKGALALLAYTLDELYRLGKEELRITFDHYTFIGGVQGAIGRRADIAFGSLGEASRNVLPEVFRELVSVNEQGIPTRRRALLSDVATTEEAQVLIDALTEGRLLVQSNSPDGPMIEIAHEALLTNWDALNAWIEEIGDDLRVLRQLRLAVRLWQRHQYSDDYMWMGQQLTAANRMVERLQPRLNDDEERFIIPEQDRLLNEIYNPKTSHYRRVQIGERLARIGDFRSGVGVREDGLPDIEWCRVEGGTVTIIPRQAAVSEADRTFTVKPFLMAKYLITYEQFGSFLLAEGGYHDPIWWSELGSHRTMPDQPRPFNNHPVEMISWYDAMAFCRWLSAQFGYTVQLPTEWQWQIAASDSEPIKNAYPWGGSFWHSDYANTRESDLLRTTAVGMYPHGATQSGIMDMVGNVWEWCLNELEIPTNIEFTSAVKRSLRGASCLSSDRKALVSYRAGNIPNRRAEAHGFRICRALDE